MLVLLSLDPVCKPSLAWHLCICPTTKGFYSFRSNQLSQKQPAELSVSLPPSPVQRRVVQHLGGLNLPRIIKSTLAPFLHLMMSCDSIELWTWPRGAPFLLQYTEHITSRACKSNRSLDLKPNVFSLQLGHHGIQMPKVLWPPFLASSLRKQDG